MTRRNDFDATQPALSGDARPKHRHYAELINYLDTVRSRRNALKAEVDKLRAELEVEHALRMQERSIADKATAEVARLTAALAAEESRSGRLAEEVKRHEADREYIIGWNDGFEFAATETFKFPTMLRKMWSGTEVQNWLDAEFARVAANRAALKEKTDAQA